MKSIFSSERGFWGLLEMLISVAVIMVAMTLCLRLNVMKPVVKPKEAAVFKEMGVETQSYQSTVESTRSRVNEVNALIKSREAAIDHVGE
jgi:competence protein ComGC